MQLDFIWTLMISLCMTLILELTFSFIFRIRNGHDLGLVVLVNVLTNPPVVLLNDILSRKTEFPHVLIVLILELTAILVEALYYKRYADKIERPFLFSLGANAFSFFTALLLQQLI